MIASYQECSTQLVLCFRSLASQQQGCYLLLFNISFAGSPLEAHHQNSLQGQSACCLSRLVQFGC